LHFPFFKNSGGFKNGGGIKSFSIVRTKGPFLPSSSPLKQQAAICTLLLLKVERPEIVCRIEGGLVVRAQYLLVPSQSSHVHLLSLDQLALIDIEDP
jgi:hypothetical protein